MPEEAVIVCCRGCGQKNRISNPFAKGGRWECAKCKHILIHYMSRPGDRLLRKCVVELQQKIEELTGGSIGIFSGKRVVEISMEISEIRSKISAWKEHLEYYSSDLERRLAREYHASDLQHIEVLYGVLEREIDRKRWLRKLMEANQVGRVLVSGFSDVLAIAGGILIIMGVPNGLIEIATRIASKQKFLSNTS